MMYDPWDYRRQTLLGQYISDEAAYVQRIKNDPYQKERERQIAKEIEEETSYTNQGDGKDDKRRLVINLIMDIRGSDGYGGIGSRGAIQLCRAIEELMK